MYSSSNNNVDCHINLTKETDIDQKIDKQSSKLKLPKKNGNIAYEKTSLPQGLKNADKLISVYNKSMSSRIMSH